MGDEEPILDEDLRPVIVDNPAGAGPAVIVCEHASNALPVRFGSLGISRAVQESHVAWDPGAAPVASAVAGLLDAPLVQGGVSRLVYDCNRPPDAPSAMPARSEVFRIPGNEALSDAERHERIAAVYEPFAARLEAVLALAPRDAALVTIHTFTPVYAGVPRPVEIGILHDEDARLADALLSLAPGFVDRPVRRNEPYGPADGVTTTLVRHALPAGRPNVMIEIRNDLVAMAADQARIGRMLAAWIETALARLGVAGAREAVPCRG